MEAADALTPPIKANHASEGKRSGIRVLVSKNNRGILAGGNVVGGMFALWCSKRLENVGVRASIYYCCIHFVA